MAMTAEEKAEKARARHLMLTYGISVEQYDRLLEAQGGRCGVCGAKPKSIRLAVEHNHRTGEIHGLACSKCNHRLLGQHGRDPEKYRRVVAFLEDPPARAVLGEHHRVPSIRRKRAS